MTEPSNEAGVVFGLWEAYEINSDGRYTKSIGFYTQQEHAVMAAFKEFTKVQKRWAIRDAKGHVYLLENTGDQTPAPIGLDNNVEEMRRQVAEAAYKKLSNAERVAMGLPLKAEEERPVVPARTGPYQHGTRPR